MKGGLACIALAVVLVGCAGSLKTSAPAVREYRLDYSPPAVNSTPLPVVLQINRFRAAAIYARESIVYRTSDYETGTYYYDRWIAHPASMLTDLLARDLAASELYRAVQQSASMLTADYGLSAEVDEIEERIMSDGCHARLTLRLLLTRTRAVAEPVLLQKTYAADEPCAARSTEAFIAAMSRAASQVSERLQKDVYDAIANDPLRPARP